MTRSFQFPTRGRVKDKFIKSLEEDIRRLEIIVEQS